MDALDVRILRTMGIQPFIRGARGPDALKPANLARRLGVSTKTAKAHLRKLEEEGVIAGYQIYPNLRHLGFQWRSYFFRAPPEAKGNPALEAVEGLVAILDFFGADMCVDLYFRDEAELRRRLHIVSELLGGAPGFEWYENQMPPVYGIFSNLDWRILKALRMRARTPLSELSDEIGVTSRTLRRRLNRMTQEGGIDLLPLSNPARLKDALPLAFLFYLDPKKAGAAIGEIEETFEASYISAWVPPSPEVGHYTVLMFAKRATDVEGMRREASDLSGVEAVEAFIPANMQHYEDWIDEAIDRKVEETR